MGGDIRIRIYSTGCESLRLGLVYIISRSVYIIRPIR